LEFVPIRTSILSNTFISYNIAFGRGTTSFIGLLIDQIPSYDYCQITYAFSAHDEVPPNTVISAEFLVDGSPPNTNITINSTGNILPFVSYLTNKHPGSEIDGMWSGLNSFGYLTVEMSYGLFQAYNMAQFNNSGYLGVYDVNATHIQINFGYTQPYDSQLDSNQFFWKYQLSSNGNALTIYGPETTTLQRVQ